MGEQTRNYTPHPYIYTFTPIFYTNFQIYPLYKKLPFHFSPPQNPSAVPAIQLQLVQPFFWKKRSSAFASNKQ